MSDDYRVSTTYKEEKRRKKRDRKGQRQGKVRTEKEKEERVCGKTYEEMS
jgi:hypothetical protein